ncbi:hypothetical protein [Paraherbaspirillum soli]|uniref:Zinc ribbon domain-containing protein n=1 Tax=Paraherbaspirillum soli TaxID=631222 RepID=A0ABW0M3H8_9BURK
MPITTCPKCSYQRQPTDSHIHEGVCPVCGIAYQKFLDRQRLLQQAGTAQEMPPSEPQMIEYEPQLPWFERLKARLLEVPERVEPLAFWARAVTLCGLALWGGHFVLAGIDWEVIGGSFLHNVILPFHEFGHVLFLPFGRFMTILGGSLFQVLMPLGLMAVFVMKQRDNFAASVTLWWSGQSFIDLSPYIADAVERSLPLVGGGGEESHDWGNLLTMMHGLPHTLAVARSSFAIGTLLMLLGLAWGATILRLQHEAMVSN